MKTIELKTWDEFRAFVKDDRWGCPTYWRGQRDPSWALASSFERIILNMGIGLEKHPPMVYPYAGRYERDGKPIWDNDFIQKYRNSFLRGFQTAAAGLRGPTPAPLDENQWWSLGRHHGLATPLLDWTIKPYIVRSSPFRTSSR